MRYTREAFKIAPRFQELAIANSANAWESNEEPHEHDSVKQRLTYSTLEGPSVFLAYQADDQNFVGVGVFKQMSLTLAQDTTP